MLTNCISVPQYHELPPGANLRKDVKKQLDVEMFSPDMTGNGQFYLMSVKVRGEDVNAQFDPAILAADLQTELRILDEDALAVSNTYQELLAGYVPYERQARINYCVRVVELGKKLKTLNIVREQAEVLAEILRRRENPAKYIAEFNHDFEPYTMTINNVAPGLAFLEKFSVGDAVKYLQQGAQAQQTYEASGMEREEYSADAELVD